MRQQVLLVFCLLALFGLQVACGKEDVLNKRSAFIATPTEEESEKEEENPKEEMIIEALCGRNRGKRTFSLTPTQTFDLDIENVTKIATEKGFRVENQGDLGLSMRTNDLSVSFMKRGSAVVVGPKDENEAIRLYNDLLGKPTVVQSQ